MNTIKTPRLMLRQWEARDWEALMRYANNRKVWMGLREIFPHPYSQKDAKWWLDNFDKDPRHHNFAVEYSKEAIGGASLHLLDDVYLKTAELGYWLGEPFWGQGLATEAVSALTAWGFDQLPIERIQAGIFSSNKSSVRVLEKVGFECEACLKKSVFKAGKLLDQFLYVKFRN